MENSVRSTARRHYRETSGVKGNTACTSTSFRRRGQGGAQTPVSDAGTNIDRQQTAVDGFSLADGTRSSKQRGAFYFQAAYWIIFEETTSQVTARQEFARLPMSRQQRQVEMITEKNKQFDPGEGGENCYPLPKGRASDGCFVCCVRYFLLFSIFYFSMVPGMRDETRTFIVNESGRGARVRWMNISFLRLSWP